MATIKTYYQLLNQPQTFAVDSLSIDNAYKLLMARLHPDRFVNASALEKRVAEQMSVRINEARQTLIDPLKRAQYLCQLKGLDPQARRAMPFDFLAKQMHWHEVLEEATEAADGQKLDALAQEIQAEKAQILKALEVAFDEEDNTAAALDATRELLFIEKLLTQIQR